MARFLVSKEPKQKHGHPSKRANKRDKNYDIGLKFLISHTLMASDLDVMLKPLI